MKKRVLLPVALLSLAVLLGGVFVLSQRGSDEGTSAPPALETRADSAPYGVFEGRVPCDGGPPCERVKVRLTLFRDPATHAPTDYMLERVYVGMGNDRTTTRGRWQVLNAGVPDRWGVAYRLDEETPMDFAIYLPVGSDLLLFLGPDLQPRVGNASMNFTLSRTQ